MQPSVARLPGQSAHQGRHVTGSTCLAVPSQHHPAQHLLTEQRQQLFMRQHGTIDTAVARQRRSTVLRCSVLGHSCALHNPSHQQPACSFLCTAHPRHACMGMCQGSRQQWGSSGCRHHDPRLLTAGCTCLHLIRVPHHHPQPPTPTPPPAQLLPQCLQHISMCPASHQHSRPVHTPAALRHQSWCGSRRT